MNDTFDSRLRRLELVNSRGGAVPAVIVILQAREVPTPEQQAEVDAAVTSGQTVVRVVGVDMRADSGSAGA